MNHARVLRVTNGLLVLIGYQVHFFNDKTRRYRLSLWAIGNFIFISVFYLIAFTHHFEHSSLLHFLKDVSPFLRQLVSLQLLLGLKVYIFAIYEVHIVTRAANELVNILPKVFAKKFSREEAYAYFLNYSTIAIALVITLYVAYEMDFELPPLDNVLIFCGLCIPHFMLGGALKLYNIGNWLQRKQLLDLQAEFQRIFPLEIEENTEKAFVMLEVGHKSDDTANQELSVPLQELQTKLVQLSSTSDTFNAALQRQLQLLVVFNNNCLLGGTYARVYYESTWNVVFPTRTKHIFQATNCGIFILIFWDYMLLFLTQSLFENLRRNFAAEVFKATKERQRFAESTRIILTDMHDVLKKGFSLKLMNSVHLNLVNFSLLQLFVGLIIAQTVIYHYLNDQILALSERFDGLDAEDD